jgi:hypothetical protein
VEQFFDREFNPEAFGVMRFSRVMWYHPGNWLPPEAIVEVHDE